MSRGINQVKNIFFSILGIVNNTNRLRLDGDTTLTFEIHVVKYLCLHLAAGQCTSFFYNTIRKCRLAMIDMGNNAKITNFALID